MGAIPTDIETDTQPPLTVPLRHFVVGLGLLLLAGVLWTLEGTGLLPGMVTVAQKHLLLAGWVCVTIMGAMTQFVPVWSGVALYSDRLASLQLWLVAPGLLGFAGLFVFGPVQLLVVPAVFVLAGFWVFVYNVGRTLARAGDPDVTEAHFGLALLWFVLVTLLGLLLASSYALPRLFLDLGIPRTNVLMAHASAAVFGAVLTTVIGALYQLAQMFTQSELTWMDETLQHGQSVGYPMGVGALVVGRLTGVAPVAKIGAIVVCVSLAAVALILAHRLYDNRVEWSPMLVRYAVAAGATLLWVGLTLPAWLADPLAYESLLGPGVATVVLLAGVLVFVVLGTLYHVIPFIVWFHRYSDRLGLEPVPMIDDLYDGRLAMADYALVTTGATLLSVAATGLVPPIVSILGAGVLTLGFAVAAINLLLVLRGHSPYSMPELLLTELLAPGDPVDPSE